MSELIEFLNKLSFNKGTSLVFIIFGTLIAPFWFLFESYNVIYNNSDILHLLILSFAIGMPVCLISFAPVIIRIAKIEEYQSLLKDHDYLFSQIGISCIIPGFSFYIPGAVKFFQPTLTQHDAIEMIAFFNMGSVTVDIIHLWSALKSKKNNIIEKEGEEDAAGA